MELHTELQMELLTSQSYIWSYVWSYGVIDVTGLQSELHTGLWS